MSGVLVASVKPVDRLYDFNMLVCVSVSVLLTALMKLYDVILQLVILSAQVIVVRDVLVLVLVVHVRPVRQVSNVTACTDAAVLPAVPDAIVIR